MKFKHALTVFRKELTDIMRDRRALFISVAVPLILFPLVFSSMDLNTKYNSKEIKKNMIISVNGGGSLRYFLKSRKNIILNDSSHPEADLKSGKIYAIVNIPYGTDRRLRNGGPVVLKIKTDNTRQSSIIVSENIKNTLLAYIKTLRKQELREKDYLSVQQDFLVNERTGSGMLVLSLLLPMLLVVFAAVSPLAVAADIGAGEKERSTIEPLLSTPPGNLSILTGKITALSVMGIIGVISFISGVAVSFILTPGFFGKENISFQMDPLPVFLIIVMTIILIVIFGTLELALSLYAKSLKEAQIFFIPLLIIAMSCAYGSTTVDPKNIADIYRHIPVINIALLIKEMIIGVLCTEHIVTTLCWSGLYIILGFTLSFRLLSNEKVLFRS